MKAFLMLQLTDYKINIHCREVSTSKVCVNIFELLESYLILLPNSSDFELEKKKREINLLAWWHWKVKFWLCQFILQLSNIKCKFLEQIFWNEKSQCFIKENNLKHFDFIETISAFFKEVLLKPSCFNFNEVMFFDENSIISEHFARFQFFFSHLMQKCIWN